MPKLLDDDGLEKLLDGAGELETFGDDGAEKLLLEELGAGVLLLRMLLLSLNERLLLLLLFEGFE